MEANQNLFSGNCPSGVPFFLEPAFLEEAAAICDLSSSMKDTFFSQAASIRNDRTLTERLWQCHWLLNNEGKTPDEQIAPDFFLTYAVLAKLPWTKAFYQSRNIPLQILRDCAQDLKIWAIDCQEKHGTWGNMHPYWLKYTFDAKLFRIGRLQFEPRQWQEDSKLVRNQSTGKLEITSIDSEETSPVIMQKGDWFLKIHIPALAPLDQDECRKSLKNAYVFFKTFLPHMTPCCFNCCSWLLDRQLEHCLAQSSNILRFQALFEDVPLTSGVTDRQHRERIFGDPDISLDQAPRDTSLQRNFIACLEKGIPFGTGQGFITLDSLI